MNNGRRIYVVCPECKTKNYNYDVVFQNDTLVEFRINCSGCRKSITHRDSTVPNIMPMNMDMSGIIDQVMDKMGIPKKKEGSDFRVK